MPTTSNFGWTTPADTDLVKDGASAIRTLGNGIDASFLDLKGGTTGQVLSKASNADLDYSWITPQVGDITEVTAGTGISGGGTSGAVTITNSMATAIDAKGDLVIGTGADTFSRLAVGSNGTVLMADSTQSTGTKWGSITTSSAWTLISTITGTSGSTISVNVSGYDRYKVQFSCSVVTANSTTGIRLNGLTASNYEYLVTANESYTDQTGLTRFRLDPFSNWDGGSGIFYIDNANSSAKPQITGYVTLNSNGNEQRFTGLYNDNINVSSISIETGNSFDGYSFRVWGL